MSAPHLPNKTCRVDTYYRLKNVKWILLFALLAFVAGGCAAIIMIVWFLPANYNSTILTSGRLDSDHNISAQPDQVFARQIKQRLLNIYDVRQKINGFYPRSAYVGQAAVLSSDGWAVAFIANFRSGAEKSYEVLDSNNNSGKIVKVVYDKTSQLVYFKINAQGLRVTTFPNWAQVNVGIDLWSVGFDWQSRFIKDLQELSTSRSQLIWQPQYGFALNEKVNAGDLLLNNNGDLVGVVGVNNIINSWQVEGQIASLLTSGKIVYKGLPYQGYFVYNFSQDSAPGSSGFYVEKSPTRVTSSTLGAGDIILEINGQVADKHNLAEQLWLAPESVPLKVWRKGVVVQMEVKKQQIEI